MSKNNSCPLKKEKLGKVGGQAVIEGVMMKSGEDLAIASRMPDGSVKVQKKKFIPMRKKYKICNIPVIRGVVNFVEMMILSFKTMEMSTAALGLEEEEPTRFEKWLEKHFGASIVGFIMTVGIILGLALSLFLFFFLPAASTNGIGTLIANLTGDENTIFSNNIFKTVFEGVIKIGIFILYIALVSFMKDIRRVFEYHGAEHKAVFCYEADLPMTVENVRKMSRFHPRCGTSFIFVMLIIGILVSAMFSFSWANIFLRVGIKLLTLPLIVGLGFEFLMYAGKHDNAVVRILSAPGLWMQRLTTKEPDDGQMECAIIALKNAIPAEFPEVTEPENTPEEGFTEPQEEPEDSPAQDDVGAVCGQESAELKEHPENNGRSDAEAAEMPQEASAAAEGNTLCQTDEELKENQA